MGHSAASRKQNEEDKQGQGQRNVWQRNKTVNFFPFLCQTFRCQNPWRTGWRTGKGFCPAAMPARLTLSCSCAGVEHIFTQAKNRPGEKTHYVEGFLGLAQRTGCGEARPNPPRLELAQRRGARRAAGRNQCEEGGQTRARARECLAGE